MRGEEANLSGQGLGGRTHLLALSRIQTTYYLRAAAQCRRPLDLVVVFEQKQTVPLVLVSLVSFG